MSNARPILASSVWGLAAGVGLAVVGTAAAMLGHPLPRWPAAHGWILVAGFLMPGLAFLQFRVLERHLGLSLHPDDGRMLAGLYAVGAGLVAVGQLFPDALAPILPFAVAGFSGFLLMAGAGMAQLLVLRRVLPKASLVDIVRDPLSKGDDACVKLLRFAHVILPIGLLLLAVSYGPGLADWGTTPTPSDGGIQVFLSGMRLAGVHLMLAGYGLLSVYGLSHLIVPRYSEIPAIAAGAIKGELHSSLLGLVLLASGFLARGTPASTGLLVAGGIFLFFAAFVFMGVLGANIMKNKSRTQRVTPEFAYIPWTFAGVFWIVAGVLLGVFLNALPDLLAQRMPLLPGALRFAHVHGLLFGGFGLLLMGYATRLLSPNPVAFSKTRWAFYATNLGLVLMIVGDIQAGPQGSTMRAGILVAAVGVGAWFMSLRRYLVWVTP